jgi:hypothetical protein
VPRSRPVPSRVIGAVVGTLVIALAASALVDASTAAVAAAHQPESRATRRLAALVARYSHTATSVAVYDVKTGATVSAGAKSGMVTASVVKVQLLETLLLKHQRAKTKLGRDEISTVTAMIEHSSNSAANSTFWDIGGRDTVVDYEKRLGLSTAKTVPGSGDYWGLTVTNARQQLVLLKNLVNAHSPLSKANRAFALSLLRHVENDQRWGVPVVADSGSSAAVKDGWLAVIGDNGRWTVNSIGLVRVHKRLLAIAVMTQHGSSFSGGISRVEALVRAAARTVAT